MQSKIAAVLVTGVLLVSCSKDPQKSKQAFLENGDRYASEKKYPEAILEYRNAIAQDPKFGEARFKLGEAYAESGQARSSLGEYVRAADLMPDHVEAQLRAGVGLLAAGQYPEAKARALAALAKDPRNVRGLVLLGNSMAGMQDMDGAIKTVQQAIDSDPREELTYGNLGTLELAQGNREAAENAFKKAAEIAPESESAHLGLANFYWASRRLDDCEKELKLAIKYAPKSPTTLRALAVFYSLKGNAAEAEQYLQQYAKEANDLKSGLALADFYLLRQDGPKARAALLPLEARPDGFVAASLRLAAVDFTEQKKTEAYARIAEVLKREPGNEAAIVEHGRFLLADGKADESVKQADLAIKGNPKAVTAYYLKGTALERLASRREAQAAYEEVLRLAPGAAAAQLRLADLNYRRAAYEEAANYARQVIKVQPQSGVAHSILARSLLAQGDVKGAEPHVMGLVRGAPDVADAQIILAQFYMAKAQPSQAATAFDKALALSPNSVEALAGRIRVDQILGNNNAARDRIARALAARPDDPMLLLLAGNTFKSLKDLDKAEASFRHLLTLNPSSIEAYAGLATIYLEQNRLDEAIHEFEELAKKNPSETVGSQTMIATILTVQGKVDEGQKLYESVIASAPESPVAANNLAWQYAQKDQNLDVALRLAQVAKEKLPESGDVSDTLGWVYYKKGLFSLAVDAFLEAAQQSPTRPNIQYRLGLAYVKTGEPQKARASFERALKLNPGFKEAEDALKQLGRG